MSTIDAFGHGGKSKPPVVEKKEARTKCQVVAKKRLDQLPPGRGWNMRQVPVCVPSDPVCIVKVRALGEMVHTQS